MKRKTITKLLILLFLALVLTFIFVGISHAQNQQASFRHLTAREGFSSATVWAIHKDSEGFIWFGAHDGLYRYDGYNFKAYKHDPADQSSLSNNSIRHILEDKDGNLWIGSSWYGLNKYNRTKDNFKRYYPNPDTSLYSTNNIFCIYQDREGTLWVSTPTGGLHQFIVSTDNFHSFRYDTLNPLSNKNVINSIYEDSKGNLWIGTREGLYIFDRKEKKYYEPGFLSTVKGIYRFNHGNEFIELEDLVDTNDFRNKSYKYITEDQSGNLWFSTRDLLKYDPVLNRLTLFDYNPNDPTTLSSDYIKKIINDPFSNDPMFWITTDWGLNHFSIENAYNERYYHDPTNPQSIAYSGMQGIYLDDNGLLWIGIENSGVSILNLLNKHYEYFQIDSPEESYQLHTATSFWNDKYGYIWIGTEEGGLFKYDQEMNLVDNYTLILPTCSKNFRWNFIFSIYESNDSVLWVGSLASGLFRYNRPNDEFISCKLYINDFQVNCLRINSIFKDSYGWYWVGTFVGTGLFYQKPGNDKTTDFQQITQEPLKFVDIRDFYEDEKGVLWIATNGEGIFLLKPKNRDSLKFERFIPEIEIGSILLNTITIFADREENIWFGGLHGLTRYSADRSITQFHSNNGLESDFIYDIEGDGQFLWMTSDLGLLRFDPEAPKDEMVKIMHVSDGVPFEDIYTFDMYRSGDGTIYIGGKRGSGKGFYRFHPNNIIENQHVPPVVITNFQVNNKPYVTDTNIVEKKHILLRYNQNYFSFEFAALDYVNPENNQYTYKLEGIDEEWIQSGNRRFVNYTGIAPGSYLFRVKGSNNDGVWNEDGTSMAITILPPPWRTWWAYSLYVLFIISILYLGIWFYLRRQRLIRRLEIEHLQTEKLEELDTMKSHFFANISHEFRTPLTLILGPVEKILTKIKDDNIRHDLSMIQRNARRLQKLINQLLSLSKLESGKLKLQAKEENIVNLVKGYVQSFEFLAKQKSIKLDFKSDKENIPLYVDQDKIEKILNNLLSNAFKFSPEGGKIEVSIGSKSTIDNRQLTIDNVFIQISNTGRGIPPDKLPHIFDRFYQADDTYTKDQEGSGIGLALTKEFVELHHGTITVESEEGVETTFSVLLPLGKEHLKEDEIIDRSVNGRQLTVESRQLTVDSLESDLVDAKTETPLVSDSRPIVLIVEDNADLRAYIRGYLDQSYQVIEAQDGKEGLDLAIEMVPDLILSDVMMPEMDGYELCKNLKTDIRTSHIPVILLTARASTESKIEGLETGADDFITKPFDAQELLVRIRNLIQQRRKLQKIFTGNISSISQITDSSITSMDKKFMNKSIEIIEKNISDADFNVGQFGQKMNMSRMQLHRKLRALVDQSAGEFIQAIRLNRAAILLKEKTGNIAEIAYDVGFKNPSYFSECFRKQFGKRPSEYIE